MLKMIEIVFTLQLIIDRQATLSPRGLHEQLHVLTRGWRSVKDRLHQCSCNTLKSEIQDESLLSTDHVYKMKVS